MQYITEFEVPQLPIAKMMIEGGAKCKGVRLNLAGYMVFQFERTDKTKEEYNKAKVIHFANLRERREQQKQLNN